MYDHPILHPYNHTWHITTKKYRYVNFLFFDVIDYLCSGFIVLMYCVVCCLGTTLISSFSNHFAYVMLQKGEVYRSCRCGILTKLLLKMFYNIR